jgi:hypothetical protein
VTVRGIGYRMDRKAPVDVSPALEV